MPKTILEMLYKPPQPLSPSPPPSLHHHLHLARSPSFTLPPLHSASFPACLLAVDPPFVALPICFTVEFLSYGVVSLWLQDRAKSEENNLAGRKLRWASTCYGANQYLKFKCSIETHSETTIRCSSCFIFILVVVPF